MTSWMPVWIKNQFQNEKYTWWQIFDTFLPTGRNVNLNAHANANWIICKLIFNEMETQYSGPEWFQDSIFNNSGTIPISEENLLKQKKIKRE